MLQRRPENLCQPSLLTWLMALEPSSALHQHLLSVLLVAGTCLAMQALEHTPEVFGSVEMLYVNMEVRYL